jgi:hypothetical protein
MSSLLLLWQITTYDHASFGECCQKMNLEAGGWNDGHPLSFDRPILSSFLTQLIFHPPCWTCNLATTSRFIVTWLTDVTKHLSSMYKQQWQILTVIFQQQFEFAILYFCFYIIHHIYSELNEIFKEGFPMIKVPKQSGTQGFSKNISVFVCLHYNLILRYENSTKHIFIHIFYYFDCKTPYNLRRTPLLETDFQKKLDDN